MAGMILAAAVALFWSLAALWIGPRLGIVDHPDDPTLKAHVRPAVPLGGIGVYAGVHLGLWSEGVVDLGLLAATTLLLLLGLADDVRRLSPAVRLAGEGVAAVLLVLWSDLPFLEHGLLAAVVGSLLVMVGVNAVNLFDGLDGLVGTTMAVTAVGTALLLSRRGLEPSFGWVVAGACTAFLVLNWHRARVFLGDNGAYVVGALLAYGILATAPDGLGGQFVVGLGLVGVFGLDVVVTILRRRRFRRPLFGGDRSHLYDQLHDRGRSVRVVAMVAGATQLGVVLVVLAADAVGDWTGAGMVGLLGAALLAGAVQGGFLRVDA